MTGYVPYVALHNAARRNKTTYYFSSEVQYLPSVLSLRENDATSSSSSSTFPALVLDTLFSRISLLPLLRNHFTRANERTSAIRELASDPFGGSSRNRSRESSIPGEGGGTRLGGKKKGKFVANTSIRGNAPIGLRN